MDGAGTWQIMLGIIRPVVRPALVTTFIFGFITAWNEFLFGLMVTTNKAVPMTVGASFFFSASGGGIQWGLIMDLAGFDAQVIWFRKDRLLDRQIA